MFGPPGHAYVYFTYGLHWLLNVVTEPAGRAAAVLVRAAEPLAGLAAMRARRPGRPDPELLRGPACLTAALGIDRAHDRADLVRGSEVFLVRGEPLPAERVGVSARIGIDYADPRDRSAPWRFFDLASPSVSGPRRRASPG
jgi:DNA-3-methyladenine glycosylase